MASRREDHFAAGRFDAAARDRLWQRFGRAAVHFAWVTITPSWHLVRRAEPSPDMEELVGYLGARGFHRAVATFGPRRGKFSTWLLVCVQREVAGHLREIRPQVAAHVPLDDPDCLTAPDDPEGDVVAFLVTEEIRDAVVRLGADERLVVIIGHWVFGGEGELRRRTFELLNGVNSEWTEPRVHAAFESAYHDLERRFAMAA